MKKEIVAKDSMCLRNFLNDNFSRNEKTVAIDKIVENCIVTRHTVYNWMYAYCRIPELHKRKIEEIFEAKIFFNLESA